MEIKDEMTIRTASVSHVENKRTTPDNVADHLPWWRQPGLRQLYLMMPILWLGSTTLGYDGSMLNGLQSMTTWQQYFDFPSGSRLGLIGAVPGFGALAVLVISPYMSDYLGRRLSTAIGAIVILIGALLATFAPAGHPTSIFVGGRFLVGIGGTISNANCPLLITEVTHPRHRGVITTIYNTLWYLGAIVAAWTEFGTLRNLHGNVQWRLPTAFQCMMPGSQLLLLWMVPESPRWLIGKGKDEEAKKILVKYHGNGNPNDSFVQWEFTEIRDTIRMESQAAASSGWYELVRTPGNRKRVGLILFTAIISQCSGNGLVSYYLSKVLDTVGITDPIKQTELNGGLTLWCWLVSLIFAFYVDKLGRRFLFLGAGIGMLIAFTVWTVCSAVYAKTGNSGAGSAVIAMIFLFYGAAGLAWPGLTVTYSAEILPYKIRAKGLTLCFVGTGLAGVFNQYVNPIGLQNLGWKFYIVYIVVLIIECLVIYFFYVETKGPTLEEIAVLFDGPNAHVMAPVMEHGMNKAKNGTADDTEFKAPSEVSV